MDKLEKALEKARRQRGDAAPILGSARSPRAKGAAKLAPSSPAPSSSTAALTPDFEGHLEENRIVSFRTRSAEADVFRLLRTQVLQAMEKGGFRTLAITSPNYGDGKTTVAINLSVGIALDLKQTVLLVDLDLRKPCIHKYLGLDGSKGLTDYLYGQTELADCLHRPPFERFSVLPAGNVTEHSSEILGSPQMGALADEMKTRYADRLVIYDIPPILAQDDPLAFLPHVDAVLLVVQDGVTKTDEITRSLDILSAANVIGTVLNAK